MQTLDGGRIGIAAQALGLGEGAVNEAIKYTQERVQFGKRLSQFQNTQFQLADMPKDAGSIGGYMVKKMIEAQERAMAQNQQ